MSAKEHCGSTQWMTHLYPELICKLLIGVCGKYEYTVLDHVTELLILLLQGISATSTTNNGTKLSWIEMELYMFAPIRSQYDHIFLFGEAARQVTQRVLFQYASQLENDPAAAAVATTDEPAGTFSEAVRLIQNVWQLHQMDDPMALPKSDGVHQFLAQYSHISDM